jgi:hypothetical protein
LKTAQAHNKLAFASFVLRPLAASQDVLNDFKNAKWIHPRYNQHLIFSPYDDDDSEP